MGDVVDSFTGRSRKKQEIQARERLRQDRELRTADRISKGREADKSRQAKQAAGRLQKASGTKLSGSALAQKGIKKRTISSFADISSAVLDEGNE